MGWREDVIVASVQRLNLVQLGIVLDDYFISAKTKVRNSYSREFLRQHGIGSVATVLAQPNDGETIAINVQRRYGLPPLEAN